jgi:hypothetical protein
MSRNARILAIRFKPVLHGRPILKRSNPETWVTEYTGYIGNNLGPNGLSSGSCLRVLRSKYPKIIIHETGEPDVALWRIPVSKSSGRA